jgi:hypothetical protein
MGCSNEKPAGPLADGKKGGGDKAPASAGESGKTAKEDRPAPKADSPAPEKAAKPSGEQEKSGNRQPTAVGEKAKVITKANFDRIPLGMSEKDIRDLLGKPLNESKAGATPILVWAEEGAFISVRIDGEKVTSKRGEALYPSVAPKLTKANLEKIKEGMTEKQVYDILGLPTSVEPVDKSLQLRWSDNTGDSKFIHVALEDGKVTVKSGDKLD